VLGGGDCFFCSPSLEIVLWPLPPFSLLWVAELLLLLLWALLLPRMAAVLLCTSVALLQSMACWSLSPPMIPVNIFNERANKQRRPTVEASRRVNNRFVVKRAA